MATIENRAEEWVPTVALGFIEVDGKLVLHQGWISTLGSVDWRPVETVRRSELGAIRPPRESVAGNADEETE